MFCPKCGLQTISDARFCRSCGTDLEQVSAVLSGKLALASRNAAVTNDGDDENSNDPDRLWSSFITNLFIGLAFLTISIVLAFTGAAGGRVWWFWMLIPGFACLGSSIASYYKAKRIERRLAMSGGAVVPASLPPPTANAVLPDFNVQQPAFQPARQSFLNNELTAPDTGKIAVPPSVTEDTTRHLNTRRE